MGLRFPLATVVHRAPMMILRRMTVVVVALFALACGANAPSVSPSPVVAASVSPTPSATRALATNDVSVLFPLGKGDLWPAALPARGGTLFPRTALDQVTVPVIRELQGPEATHAGLRVVSLRFDPCFSSNPCYPQIRLVLQGLNASGTQAFDGAFHALYNLTADEFQAMNVRLRNIATLAPENAAVTRLEVSPALVAQGMAGAYGVALRDLVTQSIGSANLAKVTFMTRGQGGGDRWDFGGFNLRDFQPSGGFSISGLDGNVLLQTVREQGGRGGGQAGYSYTVTPGTLRGALSTVLTSGAA